MLNQLVLVGRLAKEPIIKEECTIITLAVHRCYKNVNGIYETDFIDITLYKNVGTATREYCKKGDMVGVKGRVQSLNDTHELYIVGEKVTFLTNKKESEEEEV